MRRRLIIKVALPLCILSGVSATSAEERFLVREVPGIRCPATEPTYEFLLSHPAFAAALFGRLYPPLRGYSISQLSATRFLVIDRDWGLEGEADLLLRQPGKRIYRSEVGIAPTATWQVSAPIEVVLDYRQARAGPDPLTVSRLAVYFLPPPTLPAVMAQAAVHLLVPLINRQVEAVTEGSRRGCARITSDPGGLYQEMVTWPELTKTDLAAYRRLFLATEH